MEAFVLASGPSLTAEDTQRVFDWRTGGRIVIATNTTFRMSPWADYLFVCDGRWLLKHSREARETFKGQIVTASSLAPNHGAIWATGAFPGFKRFLNSGACAISLAMTCGADKVYLLGLDCQATGGMTHWHGSHPAGLGDAHSMARWPEDFKKVSDYARKKRVEVLNCSRVTALTVFPRVSLEIIVGNAA